MADFAGAHITYVAFFTGAAEARGYKWPTFQHTCAFYRTETRRFLIRPSHPQPELPEVKADVLPRLRVRKCRLMRPGASALAQRL